MPRRPSRRIRETISLRAYAIELLIYAGLVLGYFYLVLLILGDWLVGLFQGNLSVYAVVALGLIVGQGILLEMVTSILLRLIRSARR